jgi:hypothetical protein
MAKQVNRTEECTVVYDKDEGKITVEGFSFKIVLTINQMQLMNVYTGNSGNAKAKVTVMNATNVQED